MKHVSISMAVVLLLGLSLTTTAQKSKSKSKDVVQTSMHESENLPYTAMYSSKFQIGNSKFSRIVLNAWKSYDDNALDNVAEFVADTITAELPDGSVFKGKEDFMNGIKTYRGGFSTVKSEVVAWTPLKSMDKGDDMVCIWGNETDTKNDGTVQKTDLHEIWGFNKDGKVSFFKQFMSQPAKDTQ